MFLVICWKVSEHGTAASQLAATKARTLTPDGVGAIADDRTDVLKDYEGMVAKGGIEPLEPASPHITLERCVVREHGCDA